MHGTLIYASIHKHSEARQDRNQAVCALQTEPIVCRWAFNGPTAGVPLQFAAMPHTGLYSVGWKEEAAHMHTEAITDMHAPLFSYWLYVSCFPYLKLEAHKLIQGEILPWLCSEKNRVGESRWHWWNIGLEHGGKDVGCLSEVLSTLTHTCTYPLINTRLNHHLEPRPLLLPNAKEKIAPTQKKQTPCRVVHPRNFLALICSLLYPPFASFHLSSSCQSQYIYTYLYILAYRVCWIHQFK